MPHISYLGLHLHVSRANSTKQANNIYIHKNTKAMTPKKTNSYCVPGQSSFAQMFQSQGYSPIMSNVRICWLEHAATYTQQSSEFVSWYLFSWVVYW